MRGNFRLQKMARIPLFKNAARIRTLAGLWQHRGSLMRMFSDMFNGRYTATLMTKLALIAGIAYMLFPFDFIPDFIPFLGWSDDAAVLYFVVRRLIGEVNRYESMRKPKPNELTLLK